MITIFLRFPDLATALAIFAAVTGDGVSGLADVPSKISVNEKLCDVDPIGALTHDTGQVDAGGLPIYEAVNGWHCNIWVPDDAILPDALTPYLVQPVTPSRVFG